MAYQIRWDLLQPVDVQGAVQTGFERGATRSAMADLARDPTNESALSRLGMFQPEAAMQMRERARTEGFRQRARSAFDPQTGAIDPVAMRSAYAEAGDVEGAIRFDQGRAQSQQAQEEAARARLLDLARLLDDATDEPTYQRGLQAARAMGLDVSAAPPNFDPEWVGQQRQLVRTFIDRSPELTPFLREAQTLGLTPEQTREAWMNRYAAPPRIVTGPNGELLVVGGGGNAAPTAPPAAGTVEDGYRFRGGNPADPSNWEPVQGGASPSDGSRTFPG